MRQVEDLKQEALEEINYQIESSAKQAVKDMLYGIRNCQSNIESLQEQIIEQSEMIEKYKKELADFSYKTFTP